MFEKIDKNQLIGFALIFLILIGYFYYTKDLEKDKIKEQQNKTLTDKNNLSSSANLSGESVDIKGDNLRVSSDEQKATLYNENIKIVLSSLGAQIKEATLNKWNAYDVKSASHKKKLSLIDQNNAEFNISFKTRDGRVLNSKDLNFALNQIDNKVIFTADLGKGAFLEYEYKIVGDYTLSFDVRSKGLENIVNTSEKPLLNWNQDALPFEKGRSQEILYTEFRYSLNDYSQKDYDTNGFEEPKDKLDWISVKQQFFATILESKSGFLNSRGTLQNSNDDLKYLKKFGFKADIPYSNNEINQQYKWNFLPLDYHLLEQYKTDDGRDKQFLYNIPYGWFKWLCMFYFWVYNLLSKYGIQAGWIIFLMTIIVKMITSPIMYKQYTQGAKMRVLKPEIDEINQKYKDKEPVKKQQETMNLYRKAGVNPLAGCLPALIQIPIFMSLFRFFPNNISLRGESFLWADDLTAYDSIYEWTTNIPILSSIYGNHISLFTILYCAVLLVYTKMSASSMNAPTQEGMPNMKLMMYIMPLIFVFWLNSYSAALSWYYFVSNVINIIIILIIKNVLIDEEKIHAKIQENKKKPAKKRGKFQQRMQDMMQKAQEQQKQKELNKRKK